MMTIAVRHWLPIVTYCPVNHLPDLIYVTLHFEVRDGEQPPELYAVRKKVRALLSGRECFMEDLSKLLLKEFPGAYTIELRLALDRHYVRIDNEVHFN